MQTYVIYNSSTGVIRLNVTTKNIEDVNVNMQSGEAYIEADYDFDVSKFKVQNGALVSNQ